MCFYRGIAASLIQGKTVHSSFRLYTKKEEGTETVVCSLDISKENGYAISFVDFIIIDEAIMISANVLQALDVGLKKLAAQKNDKNFDHNFGGENILLFGDLAQVPAVTGFNDDYQEFVAQFHSSNIFFKFY